MEQSVNRLSDLPDELLEAIVYYLPPNDTLSFGATCRHHNTITYEPLVWRRHCIQTWRYWEPLRDLPGLLEAPPAQTKWRQLYNQRKMIDKRALDTFNLLLLSQQQRLARMEEVGVKGYDVKDLLLQLLNDTPDDADDVLARRYHAKAILGMIHRGIAIGKWSRLQRRQMIGLEEVLGAYDLFILPGAGPDLADVSRKLDSVAEAIRRRDDEWEERTVRQKAVRVAKYLRSEGLVGNPDPSDFHSLRNNFISLALFEEPHTSLPLQSVAIYCAVARRLGVNAKPSNYPRHVHAVIEAPLDRTLDGKHKFGLQGAEPESMHMDPWRTHEEVPREELAFQLSLMGAPHAQHAYHLGATSSQEVAIRTGRNIMNSVQEARDRQRNTPRRPVYPEIESAWYSMLWSMMVLGDTNPDTALHRRRQILPYLVDHYQSHFPEDIHYIESVVVPMFQTEREHVVLLNLINSARQGDKNAKPRTERTEVIRETVHFKVGQQFRHKRFRYEGMIIGWDIKCGAEDRWIEQMRVDDLSRGRYQPFYNVAADDKSIRYVAEENIDALEEQPSECMMALAGRYFKRWDDEAKLFVSNIKDEYPDD
ncbi:YccV-like-domain-containing protein [Polychaeton citri CBS 116435]|uniref:YccV-like-domain-containing protein n=1 Tax=Polychaeton citri CBS 116435 TaxID=1314669 RepID=A0A9P4QA98_9PEZI|nr:YccV-like-domain-containing protein [Polychaeton citri CBS 116435]